MFREFVDTHGSDNRPRNAFLGKNISLPSCIIGKQATFEERTKPSKASQLLTNERKQNKTNCVYILFSLATYTRLDVSISTALQNDTVV
jgi:hypothetical protein